MSEVVGAALLNESTLFAASDNLDKANKGAH